MSSDPNNNPALLVIDDEQTICSAFEEFFALRQWDVTTAASLKAAERRLSAEQFDVVFLDVRLPDGHGLDWLEGNDSDTLPPMILMTAFGDMDTVTRSMSGSAFDYLPKPIDLDKALAMAQRAAASTPVSTQQVASRGTTDGPTIVGSSPAMQDAYKRIAIFARTDSSVLILGETGTGKDLVAQRIHFLSSRSEGPMVAVNCGGLPESLVESELFGHEKGAFTGADATRRGRFEVADGGTLFLDEVGDLPPSAQVKLLRVLDTSTIERVGSATPIPLDVRVIAATNRDLSLDVAEGRFREDLYYRLAVLQLSLPPLRERRDDILPLAEFFLDEHGTSATLLETTKQSLLEHTWPGNVRELHNAIQHAATIATGGTIHPEDLPTSVLNCLHVTDETPDALADKYVASLGEGSDLHSRAIGPVEKRIIECALTSCKGNQSKAAELLGIHRNTLRKKLEELNIE